ncbi:hypothetical protein OO013_07230 [Mangrovivirga sp. M17]|uniref:Lipoprotein n=1 Tax=Mangrovivirga halotolerans TaxID=2993936 RepID=A0ABT3RR34_9BACT|nr:hypothetical protein [Mangrovivirga halotolerans]MCX2743650.1 hypothetical protein [Mangrovivirga halotolerans]
MRILNRILILSIFGVFSFLLSCVIEPHNADEPKYYVKNNTSENILWDSYNSGINRAQPLKIDIEQDIFTGGGGITTVDSVIFIKEEANDTLIYRHPVYGNSQTKTNHFFERENWIELSANNYYFILTDEDFK